MKKLIVIICLAILALASGGFALWFIGLRVVKPDFDEVGGTILVYQIRDDKLRDRQDTDVAARTAEALQHRLDPGDLGVAVVLPVGKDRVEIRLPNTSVDHAELVAQVKTLVSTVGLLDFRILANDVDDKEAIEEAGDLINNRVDEGHKLKADLAEAQNTGAPPPSPRMGGTVVPKEFIIKLKGGDSVVTYSWVELGRQVRMALGFDQEAQKEPGSSHVWMYLADRRNQAAQVPPLSDPSGPKVLQGALFLSRECRDINLPEEVRRDKQFDYFVLARNSEIDPITKKATPVVDSSYLEGVYHQTDATGRPAISFSLSATGGKLFGDLTRKNVPTNMADGRQAKRYLAIVLDGLVMSAATINSEIGQHGQITGTFTKSQINQMVNILRAGALPAALRPQPMSQTEVPPKKGK